MNHLTSYITYKAFKKTTKRTYKRNNNNNNNNNLFSLILNYLKLILNNFKCFVII